MDISLLDIHINRNNFSKYRYRIEFRLNSDINKCWEFVNLETNKADISNTSIKEILDYIHSQDWWDQLWFTNFQLEGCTLFHRYFRQTILPSVDNKTDEELQAEYYHNSFLEHWDIIQRLNDKYYNLYIKPINIIAYTFTACNTLTFNSLPYLPRELIKLITDQLWSNYQSA